MMPNTHTADLHTARTIALSKSSFERDDTEEAPAWGTMDQAPARVARPGASSSRWVEWGIVLAATAMVGGVTLVAGTVGVGAAAYTYANGMPGAAAASLALPVPGTAGLSADEAPEAVVTTRGIPAPIRAVAPAKAPEQIHRGADDGTAEMSVKQLRTYMAQRSGAQATHASTAPAAAPVRTSPTPPVRTTPTPPVRTAPVQRAPVAAPVASTGDAELDAILADEPMGQADAPQDDFAPAAADAGMAAPAASTRALTMANGVIVLDQPLDPVPVAIRADGDAAVYVDGEMLGAAPLAVVLERGGHTVTITGAKGTAAFDLDAGDTRAWCFNVRKDPKVSNCR